MENNLKRKNGRWPNKKWKWKTTSILRQSYWADLTTKTSKTNGVDTIEIDLVITSLGPSSINQTQACPISSNPTQLHSTTYITWTKHTKTNLKHIYPTGSQLYCRLSLTNPPDPTWTYKVESPVDPTWPNLKLPDPTCPFLVLTLSTYVKLFWEKHEGRKKGSRKLRS